MAVNMHERPVDGVTCRRHWCLEQYSRTHLCSFAQNYIGVSGSYVSQLLRVMQLS